MAQYLRILSTRSTLLKRRHHPSYAYALYDRDEDPNPEKPPRHPDYSHLANRSHPVAPTASGFIRSTAHSFGSGNLAYLGLSPSFRYISTEASSAGGGDSDNIEIVRDIANVLMDDTVVQAAVDVAGAAPAANEVAVAAADSFLPIAFLQHVIDAVHVYTGLGWWASIAVTTLLIRTSTLPLLIRQIKATSMLTLLRPRLDEIRQEMEAKGMDPAAVAEGQKRMKSAFKEFGVNPFTPFVGMFIQGPIFISFFMAIRNMAEKVPSFKSGGAFWFADLTTPDTLYIFPFLTTLSILITVECNMQEGLEGNPIAGTMKKFSRIFAIAAGPLTVGFPKAIFCYWITSNLFSLVYGLALKVPGVKKSLGIPEILAAPATSSQKPSFDLFSALKQNAAAREDPTSSSSVESSSKLSGRRVSSSSILSQRLRSLEKQVKARTKNKRT